MFKNTTGELIAPEKIESVLITAVPIDQIIILGSGSKSSLICIAIIDFDTIIQWLEKEVIN